MKEKKVTTIITVLIFFISMSFLYANIVSYEIIPVLTDGEFEVPADLVSRVGETHTCELTDEEQKSIVKEILSELGYDANVSISRGKQGEHRNKAIFIDEQSNVDVHILENGIVSDFQVFRVSTGEESNSEIATAISQILNSGVDVEMQTKLLRLLLGNETEIRTINSNRCANH